jgi:hypothetical protein
MVSHALKPHALLKQPCWSGALQSLTEHNAKQTGAPGRHECQDDEMGM